MFAPFLLSNSIYLFTISYHLRFLFSKNILGSALQASPFISCSLESPHTMETYFLISQQSS